MQLNTNVFYVRQVTSYLWHLTVVRVAYIQLLFNQLQIQGQWRPVGTLESDRATLMHDNKPTTRHTQYNYSSH